MLCSSSDSRDFGSSSQRRGENCDVVAVRHTENDWLSEKWRDAAFKTKDPHIRRLAAGLQGSNLFSAQFVNGSAMAQIQSERIQVRLFVKLSVVLCCVFTPLTRSGVEARPARLEEPPTYTLFPEVKVLLKPRRRRVSPSVWSRWKITQERRRLVHFSVSSEDASETGRPLIVEVQSLAFSVSTSLSA